VCRVVVDVGVEV